METNRIEERIYLNNEDEREIDLLDCIFSVLDKWRVLVLIGIAAFIVLGAFTFIKTEMGRKENEALIAEGREDEVINPSAYQSALDALDAKEREIRELETAIVKERTNITENSQNIKDAHNGISSSRESIKIFTERQDVASTKLNEITDYLDNSVLM